MSFLHADLSSDEEDDDYRPDLDKSAPKEDREEVLTMQLGKRTRGDDGPEENYTIEELAEMDKYDVRKQAKKVKIGHLWELLNSKPGSNGPSASSGPSATEQGQQEPQSTGTEAPVGPSAAVSLATLCRTVDTKERKKETQTCLGLAPPKPSAGSAPSTPAATPSNTSTSVISKLLASAPPKSIADFKAAAASTTPSAATAAPSDDTNGTRTHAQQAAATTSHGKAAISEEAKAAAAAALAAAREGSSVNAVRLANTVTVTETRRFAGKDIQVAVQVDRNSKEAQRAAERAAQAAAPKSGLDAFLAEVDKKKKVNVLDKTKADWQQLKASDTTLEEELEAHKRSGDKYLDKVDFLKRAELREYELERDKRLASDVRTRGRL